MHKTNLFAATLLVLATALSAHAAPAKGKLIATAAGDKATDDLNAASLDSAKTGKPFTPPATPAAAKKEAHATVAKAAKPEKKAAKPAEKKAEKKPAAPAAKIAAKPAEKAPAKPAPAPAKK